MTQRVKNQKKRTVLYAVLVSILVWIGCVLPAASLVNIGTVTAQAAQTQQVETAEASAGSTEKKSTGKRVVTIVVIGVIVGVFAVLYGLTNMASEKERKNEIQLKIEKGSKDSE